MADIFTSMLPAAFLPYEHDELDIPRAPRKQPPCTPTRRGLARTFALLDFWIGAAKSRSDGTGIITAIIADITAGVPLTESASFKSWLAPSGKAGAA